MSPTTLAELAGVGVRPRVLRVRVRLGEAVRVIRRLLRRAPTFEASFGDRTSVAYNGREVRQPILRVLVATVALTFGLLALVLGLLAFALAVVAIPLSLPVHFALRGLGRRGFVVRSPGSLGYNIGVEGFRRDG